MNLDGHIDHIQMDNSDIENPYINMDTETKYNKLSKKIIDNIIYPSYYQDVSDYIYWRYRWRKIANLFETLAKILSALGSIFAFASGFYQMELLSFISGCIGTVSIVFLQYSSYAVKESNERNMQLNQILISLNIKNMRKNIDSNMDQ